MVVWPKPCESRSSPGFTSKTPLLTQRGFFFVRPHGMTRVGSVPKRLPITAMDALTPGPLSKRCPSHTEPSPVIAMPHRMRTVQRQSIGMRPYQCGALPARRHRVVHSPLLARRHSGLRMAALGRVGSQTTPDNRNGCFDAGTRIEAVPQLHRALPVDCNAISERGPCDGSRSGCDPASTQNRNGALAGAVPVCITAGDGSTGRPPRLCRLPHCGR